MKQAVFLLVLACALVFVLQTADALTCVKGKSVCGGKCCNNGPPNSIVTCAKGVCGWGCPKGRFKCAGSCWKIPANSNTTTLGCSTRGEFMFKCNEMYTKSCNMDRCCFLPPGTIADCKKDGTCSATCPKGKFLCAAQCWTIPPNCNIFCAAQGEARCKCKPGYKYGGSYLKCVKA